MNAGWCGFYPLQPAFQILIKQKDNGGNQVRIEGICLLWILQLIAEKSIKKPGLIESGFFVIPSAAKNLFVQEPQDHQADAVRNMFLRVRRLFEDFREVLVFGHLPHVFLFREDVADVFLVGAAPSGTTTLLRLHPPHEAYLRQRPPCG